MDETSRKTKETVSSKNSGTFVNRTSSSSHAKRVASSDATSQTVSDIENLIPGAPKNWRTVLKLIKEMRKKEIAPVDTMGCERLADENRTEEVKRFQALVALMLSSQTADPVTAAAIENLQSNLPGGLTVDDIRNATVEDIQKMIFPVGFYRRKAIYLKKVAEILKEEYNGDIPDTIEGMTKLPGVGPKMSYLLMQTAWGRNMGIGVDVHVHRM